MPPPTCRVIQLGTVDYRRAWDLQVELAREVHDGRQPNTLLLLEHSHVYTRGRLSRPEHLLLTPAQLIQRGIELVETDRGGQITYHGPGQLVAYPVVDLRDWGGPLKYVRALEQIIIQSLASFGIAAGLVEGLTGVWAGERKIAAIGVKISRGVAHHGFAINVDPDLSYFDHIVPCGISDRAVTSIQQILGQKASGQKASGQQASGQQASGGAVDPAAVRYSVAYHFGQGMGFRMVEASGSDPAGTG
ncbi:MAG TPA: lipoyl(octanoyl) transferase LipB [Dehalococcoidia bacterium]|nr:lipoyl(octanoyl) transferase LipB [Dehalococcoidia bacterium]